MLEAPVVKAILEPATSDTLLDVPFNAKLVAVGGAGTEIVMLPAPAPTEAIPAPEMFSRLLNVPAELLVVLPRAVSDTVEKLVTDGVVAEIVRLPAPIPTEMIPAPDTLRRFENVPAELTVVFPSPVIDTEDVCTAGVGAEIVMLPAPAPTLIIPAPEMFNRFEKVPVELTVVFPRIVRETEEVCTLAEIVIVLAAFPIPMPAPADTDIAPLEAFRRDTLFSALLEALKVRVSEPAPDALATEMLLPPTRSILIAVPVTEVPPPLKLCVPAAPPAAPTIVITCSDCDSVMFAPPTKETPPEVMLVDAPAVFPLEICRELNPTGGAVTESVMLPAPAPTLKRPAPEIFSRLLKVPDELTVVFPNAVMEMEEV